MSVVTTELTEFNIVLAADRTTTSNAAADVTGMSCTLLANSVYSVSGVFKIGCSSTGGVKLASTAPAGSTVAINISGTTTSNTASIFQADAAGGILTAAYCTEASAWRSVIYNGTITTGATAGTFQVQFASGTNGQTSTMYKSGSFLRVKKVA